MMSIRGRYASLLALGLVAILVAPSPVKASEPPPGFQIMRSGTKAPHTSFASRNGVTTIAELAGKVAIINVWATWCPPCVNELPSLARLAKKLRADKFSVLAISQDRGGASVVDAFAAKIDLGGLPVYFDPSGKVFREFGVRGLPTTFVVDGHGFLVARLEGPAEWDSEAIVSYLNSLIR